MNVSLSGGIHSAINIKQSPDPQLFTVRDRSVLFAYYIGLRVSSAHIRQQTRGGAIKLMSRRRRVCVRVRAAPSDMRRESVAALGGNDEFIIFRTPLAVLTNGDN
jgi:hypothetical protein